MTERPRVVLCQRSLPPYRSKFIEFLWKRCGIELHVVVGDVDSGMKETSNRVSRAYDSDTGVSLWHVPMSVSEFPTKLFYHHKLRSVLEEVRPDAVIAELNLRVVSNLTVVLPWCKVFKVPIIWWGHAHDLEDRNLWHRCRTLLGNAGDNVITYTETGRRRYSELAGRDGKFVVAAPNSVDTKEIERFRQSTSYEARDSILYVGRLVPEKELGVLVDAFGKLECDKKRALRLVVIGEGPAKEMILRRARATGVEGQLQLPGAIYDIDQLAEYYNSTLVGVSPGYVGLFAIQCLAFGVPLVVAEGANHSPEIEAVRRTYNSLTFQRGSPQSLAGTLNTLMESRAIWSRLAKNASEITGTFSTELMVDGFERALESVGVRCRSCGSE